MGVLDDLLNPQNSRALRQIAGQTGVGEAEAQAALKHLAPAISRGLQRNIGAEGGLESLLQALQRGNHGRYLDDPGQLGNAVDDGNNILGHIFGSKEVSRGVANQVSRQTGIGADLLKQMLPLIASIVMGALAKKTVGGGLAGEPGAGGGLADVLGSVLGGGRAPQAGGGLGDILGSVLGSGSGTRAAGGGGLGGILSSMLDSDRDGSAFDDILDMATRGRR